MTSVARELGRPDDARSSGRRRRGRRVVERLRRHVRLRRRRADRRDPAWWPASTARPTADDRPHRPPRPAGRPAAARPDRHPEVAGAALRHACPTVDLAALALRGDAARSSEPLVADLGRAPGAAARGRRCATCTASPAGAGTTTCSRACRCRRCWRRRGVRPGAAYVLVHAEQDYTTNLPLADLDRPDNLLALSHNGEPLTPGARRSGAAAGAASLSLEERQVGHRASSCSRRTSRGSGSRTATTCGATRGGRSGTGGPTRCGCGGGRGERPAHSLVFGVQPGFSA